jgi:hypothetical protein
MTLRERLTASVTDIRARGQRLVQLNLELLSAELKAKGRQFGAAIGLFIGAGVLALYAFGFALATIAVALAIFLPLWLSLLIVTLVLFLIVAIMVLVGRSRLRKASEQAPETALAEAKKTADLMRTNVSETAAGVRAKVALRRKPTNGGTPTDGGTAPGDGMSSPAPTPTPEPPGPGDQPPATPIDAGATDS